MEVAIVGKLASRVQVFSLCSLGLQSSQASLDFRTRLNPPSFNFHHSLDVKQVQGNVMVKEFGVIFRVPCSKSGNDVIKIVGMRYLLKLTPFSGPILDHLKCYFFWKCRETRNPEAFLQSQSHHSLFFWSEREQSGKRIHRELRVVYRLAEKDKIYKNLT